jgi:hypothetical protein
MHGRVAPGDRRHPDRLRWGWVARALTLFAWSIAIASIPSGAAASGCPTSTEESPGFRAYLPECRAYELVSPPYTGGFAIFGGLEFASFRVADDGEGVIGSSLGSFAGQESGFVQGTTLGTAYGLTRAATGWQSSGLNPPASQFPFSAIQDAGADLQRSLFYVASAVFKEGPADYVIREANGSLAMVGPESPVEPVTGYHTYLGGSADLSRIAFELSAANSAGRDVLWPGDTTIAPSEEGAQRFSLYENSGTGNAEPKLVGVENSTPLTSNEEADLIGQCGVELGGSEDAYNAISPSGFAIFFTPAPGPCSNAGETEAGTAPAVAELYARIEGARTLAISEPSLSTPGRECTGTCAEYQNEEGGHTRSAGQFAGASADGHRVFFITEQPLLNSDLDTSPDLYMADLSATGVSKLLDVSLGGNGDPTPGEGAEVQGVVRIAEDGSMVYFVANGALTSDPNANGETAVAGARNLYVYDVVTGRTTFVAELATGDSTDWSARNFRTAQASAPDGRFLVFSSKAHLQGTGDTSGNGSNVAQLFEYDNKDHGVARVSIGQQGEYLCSQTALAEPGFNCNGNVQSAQQAPTVQRQDYFEGDEAARPNMNVDVTGDGTVFFESKDSLTPDAVNGFPNTSPGFPNVYEYHDGNVFLISDGHEAPVGESGGKPLTKTQLVGAAGDGEGVLFLTADSLVPQDGNTQVSLYDARIDGGFPAPPLVPGCTSEACRGAASAAPTSPTVGSVTQHGSGNEQPARKCRKGKVRRRGKCVAKKHTHRHRAGGRARRTRR